MPNSRMNRISRRLPAPALVHRPVVPAERGVAHSSLHLSCHKRLRFNQLSARFFASASMSVINCFSVARTRALTPGSSSADATGSFANR